ncbi:MAG: hypothetical protein U9P14_04220, partial [Gemmatimonadota bacterium]|nr:hypothetical protein [Gemmatimonadota bacterium]
GQGSKSAMLVMSEDKGETWNLVAELPGRSVIGIVPGSLAGREDEVTVFTGKGCVRVNTGTGEITSLPLPVEWVTAAEEGTGQEGTTIYILSPMKLLDGKLTGGVYRSTDWAETWTQVNNGLLYGVPEGSVPGIRTLAVCRTQPGVVYLSSRNSRSVSAQDTTAWNYAVFKTEDSGRTWKPSHLSNSNYYMTGNYTGSWMERAWGPGWGGNPIHLGVAPSDPDICYTGDYGRACRTTDGGRAWTQIYSHDLMDGSVATGGLDVTTCYGVHFDPFRKGHFFISYTDMGLFHTFNGGESWFHSLEGIPRSWTNTCYWVEFDPEVMGRVWTVWGNAHDLPRDKMFGRSGSFDRFQGGIAVSDDDGLTWRKCSNGIPPSVCTNVLVDPASSSRMRTLYVTAFGRGVYKSFDGARSWSEANGGLGKNLYAWQMRRNSAGRLFVLLARGRREGGTVDGELYFSDDKAASWKPLALPEGVNAPHDLQIDPTDDSRMYLSCWTRTGEDGTDTGGGLFRTEDGGSTWKQVFDPRYRVNSAALDPRDPNTIFINTFQNAAFRSDDRGETWERIQGYRFKWGQRAIPDPENPGMLFLTTYGGSVYYGPARGVPDAFEDIENMPDGWW